MTYKVAVVTPYYKEDSDILEQCSKSVLSQTYDCDHIVVSDGHKNELFDRRPNTLHISLPKESADNGNTPRGIGSIFADMAGYDAIAYLDADNWFHPEHISKLVAVHERSKRHVICGRRDFYDLSGELLPITEPAEDLDRHFDTSCFIIFRKAFSVIRAWFMPRELGPICDRIFLQAIYHEGFVIAALRDRTVSFRTNYEFHYQLANKPIPKGAKSVDELHKALEYLRAIDNVPKIVDRLGFYPVVTV